MTLNNFEEHIEYKILDRGYDYTTSIHDIEQIKKGEFRAIVSGSMEYNVMLEVDIDDDLYIADHSCDCPYDWGIYCKHVVAMMYHIKEEKLYNQPVTENTYHKIEQDLVQFDKEELIYLLVELCKDKQTIKKMIMKELGYDK